ncbi:unnamed protein product [Candidula unifasciata]|uniref:Uncharacterized protein n=1 Tax=Candidula unifasciata TaxID=100452 RepID=A0A8S3Z3X2_9EUPU|nr:unnamed protein product [Candidula unifasciata]
MAQFSLATLMTLVVIAVLPDTSVSHIIGGGHNTKRYPGIVNSGNSNLLNSALSELSSLVSGARSNQRESPTNEDQGSSDEAEDNRSESYNGADINHINVRLPPSVFAGMDRVNPFIRNKRQACQMTHDLTRNLKQMISRLNSTMYLGHMPQQSSESMIPDHEPPVCPTNTNVLSSSTEERLRSNCPWKLTRRDLGPNAYPRYVPEAVCICSECVGSAMNSCQTLTAPVTYFELHSCQDDMALMVKKVEMVAVGCFCAGPSPNSAADPPSANNNAVNDY